MSNLSSLQSENVCSVIYDKDVLSLTRHVFQFIIMFHFTSFFVLYNTYVLLAKFSVLKHFHCFDLVCEITLLSNV